MNHRTLERSAVARCVIYIMLSAILLVAFQCVISAFLVVDTDVTSSESLNKRVPSEDYAVLPPEVVAEIVLALCAERENAGEGGCSWE